MNSKINPKYSLVFLCLFVCLAFSGKAFGEYHFDTWTTDNGLPQNGLREITQTPDGYLWFTTFDGLVRFDGVRFTTFGKGNTKGIINNRFTSIYSEKDGTLYASTTEDGVLTVYKNGFFKSYTSAQVPGHYIKTIKPDKNGEVRFLTEDQDRKSRTWYYLRNDAFIAGEIEPKLTDKIELRGNSGKNWTVTKTGTSENVNGKTILYPHKIGLITSTLDLFEDKDGGLWIGGTTLTYLKDGQIKTFGKKEGFPVDADFHTFWQEKNGSVWFANGGASAAGVGLVRYKDGEFENFGKEKGLSNTSIYDVFKDREDNLWLATNRGLNRLRKDVVTAYSVDSGLSNSEVYPIYRDSKDAIWIGTVSGLDVYRNGKFESVKLKQANENVPEHTKWIDGKVSVQSIFEDRNGKMWIGVAGGIFIVQNGKAETLKDAEGYHVHSFQQDKTGAVWAATNKGIIRFEDYKIRNIYSEEDGLPNDFVTVIHEDSGGSLWFGGLGGLSEFKNGKFKNYSSKEGLAGNYVRTIYEDKEKTLWIGTYDEGLSRFKNGRFTNYRVENGLFNNGVFAIEEDPKGNFWISSNNGIYRTSRKQLEDFAEGRTSRIDSVGYGKEDGMLNNECNGGRQPASIKDKDGNFWFPTQDGVVVIDPKLETKNALPPSVVIESATVERTNVDLNEGLLIKAGQKNIEIRFTGISLIKSEQVKFKYKLEGHDPDWIDADTRRTAYYSYLPPGNYKFLVKAANSDGVWNEEGAVMNVELEPFFYQTYLFYVLCTVIGVLILLLFWKKSVLQMEAREKQLAILVEEKTEELERANQELRHLANSDGLTAIGNRRRFEEFLADEWHRAIRFKTEISLVLLDIDHFKLFNDKYGHLEGDDCLKQVAEALENTIHRPTDLVARFGGEEFAIVLGGTDSAGAIQIATEAFENVMNLKILHEDSETSDFLTVSVGIATTFAVLGMSEVELISAADEALYKAKQNGRGRIENLDMTLSGIEETDDELVPV